MPNYFHFKSYLQTFNLFLAVLAVPNITFLKNSPIPLSLCLRFFYDSLTYTSIISLIPAAHRESAAFPAATQSDALRFRMLVS